MRKIAWLLIGSSILVAGLAGFVLWQLSEAPAADTQARVAAEARWERRGFRSYRIVLEESNCTTDYEVDAERIAWGIETPCGRGQARTITNLFAVIAGANTDPICTGARCICERATRVDVQYEATLGYPERITIRNLVWPNLRAGSFWSALSREWRDPCPRGNARTIRVRELIPNQR